jgi:hypothetical protein
MSHRWAQKQLDAGNPGQGGMERGSVLDAAQMWGAIGQLMQKTKDPMASIVQNGKLNIPNIFQDLIGGNNKQS